MIPMVPWDMRSMRNAPASIPLWAIKDTLPGVRPVSQMVGVTRENIHWLGTSIAAHTVAPTGGCRFPAVCLIFLCNAAPVVPSLKIQQTGS